MFIFLLILFAIGLFVLLKVMKTTEIDTPSNADEKKSLKETTPKPSDNETQKAINFLTNLADDLDIDFKKSNHIEHTVLMSYYIAVTSESKFFNDGSAVLDVLIYTNYLLRFLYTIGIDNKQITQNLSNIHFSLLKKSLNRVFELADEDYEFLLKDRTRFYDKAIFENDDNDIEKILNELENSFSNTIKSDYLSEDFQECDDSVPLLDISDEISFKLDFSMQYSMITKLVFEQSKKIIEQYN